MSDLPAGPRVGLVILFVDDDPLMHRMLTPRLTTLPTRMPVTQVATAQSPEAALAHLDTMHHGPLAVVSDFNLKAAMNGSQLLRAVHARRPDALRVLVSGYSLEQLGSVDREGAADAFLEKPLKLDELLEPLTRLLDERFAPEPTRSP